MITITRPRPPSPDRQLSFSAPVELVESDGSGGAWLESSEGRVRLVSLENLWEIDGHRQPGPPALRMHFRANTEDGQSVLLYQDLLEGRWYRQFTLGS